MAGRDRRTHAVPRRAPDPMGHAAEHGYAVGEVARLANVSVRTLHHYDAIGLLSPERRGDNRYRRYGPGHLARLQRILAYRELGFDLQAIHAMLDDPELDEQRHLQRQKALLEARRERLEAMLRALDKTMEARQMGIDLDPKDMLQVFGEFDPSEHAEEARERWGDTDAYRQSHRRTGRYGKDDWLRIRGEADAVEARFSELLEQGVAPHDARAMDAAEAHRRHIATWFYDCSKAMHVGLADLYETDPRFRRHYEDRSAGLATYVAAAIRANAERD